MATVYLARDLKHDRDVALKVLRPELAAVLGAKRFLREIKITAHLQHPHILPLHDSGEADSFLFYVMPYVEGETLRDKLRREKQLDIAEAIDITRSVASALDYAHRQGVIHRDIKPANILLHEGQALVADFGIALAMSAEGEDRLTETGISFGTPPRSGAWGPRGRPPPPLPPRPPPEASTGGSPPRSARRPCSGSWAHSSSPEATGAQPRGAIPSPCSRSRISAAIRRTSSSRRGSPTTSSPTSRSSKASR